MIKCNNCWGLNKEWNDFCMECWTKLIQQPVNSRNRNNVENEIELNIDLSFIKNLWNNQKYIVFLSWLIIISFFTPFFTLSNEIKKSLFDIWSYTWIVFFTPLVFFLIQYFYSLVKPSIYNKWLWQLIIIVLTSIILTYYFTLYLSVDKIKELILSIIPNTFGYEINLSIGYVLWLIWYIWILFLSIIETLNIFKKVKNNY